jgi:hypothetical protein
MRSVAADFTKGRVLAEVLNFEDLYLVEAITTVGPQEGGTLQRHRLYVVADQDMEEEGWTFYDTREEWEAAHKAFEAAEEFVPEDNDYIGEYAIRNTDGSLAYGKMTS